LKPIIDFEGILAELLEEHRKLLMHLEVHQAAMQSLNIAEMEAGRSRQELCRTRILRLEDRRRQMALQIGRINQIKGEPKIPVIADLYPARRAQLLALREQLQQVMKQVADRSFIASRLASSVLGHLNTTMRIVAGAAGGGGVYNNRGVPKVTARIGVMEAVG
jgi:hypothetical protein